MQLRLKELREDLGLSVKDMARDTGVSQNTIHLYERGGYPLVEKIIYKESPTARLPDYHNNNNDGKIIKWVKSKRYMGGKVWSKRT